MSQGEPDFTPLEGAESSTQVDRLRRQAVRLLQQSGDRAAVGDVPSELSSDAPDAAPARAFAAGLITMAAVFAAVVAGALAVFGQPVDTQAQDASAPSTERLDQPARRPAVPPTPVRMETAFDISTEIVLPDEMQVLGISLDGDRVALHLNTPMGAEIRIFDFTQGRFVASAPIRANAPENRDEPMSAAEDAPDMERSSRPTAPTLKPQRGV